MYRSGRTRKRRAALASDGSDANFARSPTRVESGAIRGRRASSTCGSGGVVSRLLVRKLAGWLAAAMTALLFVPAVASAAFVLAGKTGQGLPVAVRLSTNLSTVTRFAVGWRATCGPGGSLSGTTLVRKPIAVRPFPNFQGSATYEFSTGNSANGQTVRVVVSVQLHGALMRNGRAGGRWAAQARVVDASGNQLGFCRTGVVRWRATLI
jgi:hypothetical protein